MFVTLVGIGYILRQQQEHDRVPTQTNTIHHYPGASRLPRAEVDQKPRGKRFVDRVEKRYADRAYDTGIISSELSGRIMSVGDFSHNNMVPFFRGSVKQASASSRSLETFTGNSSKDVTWKKDPNAKLFAPEDASMTPGDLIGTAASSDYLQEFQASHTSIQQKNVLPFKQERVGPGVLGETNPGYQQLDINEIVRPKPLEETRSAVNQKSSYEGRVVDGKKPSVRGELGEVRVENRYVRFISQGFDHFFRTLGAFAKPTNLTAEQTKIANKRLTDEEIQSKQGGGGGATSGNKRPMVQHLEPGARRTLDRDTFASDIATDRKSAWRRGRGNNADHGRSAITVYDRDRSKTTTITNDYSGGLTSLVKAMIAPLQDVIKRTPKKEIASESYAKYTTIDPQIPSKGPTKDPDDIAKRTIRQDTSESMGMEGNLHGSYKLTVFDPDDITKRTIKETFVKESEIANLRGPYKITVYDPADHAKKTLKETLENDDSTANLTGPRKGVAYDASQKARTTVKEAYSEESEMLNFFANTKKGQVQDPDSSKPRTTLKEQFSQDSSLGGNYSSSMKHGQVKDPDEKARTTLKEQFSLDSSSGGNYSSSLKHGQVQDPDEKARTTIKEQFSLDSSLGGNYSSSLKRGQVQDPDEKARTTLKEQFSQESSLGGNYSSSLKKRTVQDPDDLARMTIKEQYAQEADIVNVHGQQRPTTRDPDARTRTTLKEAYADEAPNANLSSAATRKGPIFDPENILKTTIRQGTSYESAGSLHGPQRERVTSVDDVAKSTIRQATSFNASTSGSVEGPRKSTVYDPSDVARTTLKEDYAELETELGGVYGSERHGDARVAGDRARTTLKQDTLSDREFMIDASHKTKVNRVFDPDDRPLSTLKDAGAQASMGHVQSARMKLDSAYTNSEYDAAPTFREMTTENKRKTAAATRGDASAYKVIDVEAPETQKQSMHDERTGNAGAISYTKETSYEHIYNAAIDGIKESTVVGRDFVAHGSKVSPNVNMTGEQTAERHRSPERGRFPDASSGGALIPALPSVTFMGSLRSDSLMSDNRETTRQPPGPFDLPVHKRNYDADPSRQY